MKAESLEEAIETPPVDTSTGATSEGEPSPDEVEAALSKLDSAKTEKVEAKTGAEETPPPEAKEKDEGEPEPETPALEPPKFWNAEARERFKALPPELQTYVLEQEENAHKARSKSINDAAELKKAAETDKVQAAQQAQQFAQANTQVAQYLNSLIEQTRQTDPVLAQWYAIPDKVKYATEHPNEYQRLHAAVMQRTEQLNTWEAQRNQAAQTALNATNTARQSFLAEQNRLLIEKIPEWKDPDAARKSFGEVLSHAQSKYAVSPQEIHNVGDHRLVVVLRDNMALGQKVESLEAEVARLKVGKDTAARTAQEKKVAVAPRVIKPKAAEEGQGDTQRSRDLINRARKTTSDRDRADLIAAALR